MSKKFPLLNLNLEFLDLAPCRFASINVFVLSLSDFKSCLHVLAVFKTGIGSLMI